MSHTNVEDDAEAADLINNDITMAPNTNDSKLLFRCGSVRINRYCGTFTFAAIFSIAAVTLSIYKLIVKSTSDTERIFWSSLLSGTIGLWLPNPKLK